MQHPHEQNEEHLILKKDDPYRIMQLPDFFQQHWKLSVYDSIFLNGASEPYFFQEPVCH